MYFRVHKVLTQKKIFKETGNSLAMKPRFFSFLGKRVKNYMAGVKLYLLP